MTEQERQRLASAELCIAEISLIMREPGSAADATFDIEKALDDHLARRALQQELNKENK